MVLKTPEEEDELFGAYRHLNLTLGEHLDSQVYQAVDVKRTFTSQQHIKVKCKMHLHAVSNDRETQKID